MHLKVCLALHGSEATDLGGPSIRVPRTAHLLKEAGINAKSIWIPADILQLQDFDLLHIFNVWPLSSCLSTISISKLLKMKVVLSPILLDFSNEEIWNPNYKPSEPGFFGPYRLDYLENIFNLADHLIFLSEYERKIAKQINLPQRPYSIVYNPVRTAVSRDDGEAFRSYFQSRFGRACPERFLLCVGRIEPRKNQLSLIKALTGTDIPLLLAGHEADQAYAAACHKAAGANVIFLGRLPHENGIMLSTYQAAAACAQITWAEGASLASLEAVAANCPLILSDLPNNREYFGESVLYVDPQDIINIKFSVLKVFQEINEKTLQMPREKNFSKFNYENHIECLKKIYKNFT